MHATHTIPRVAVGGVVEDEFRCYPMRGDSLAFYSRLYGHRLHLRKLFEITPEQAAAVIARRLGVDPVRPTDAAVTLRTRFVATALGVARSAHHKAWLRLPVRKTYTKVLSPGSATYRPPFFKSFLRLDVTPDGLRVRCYAATGMREQEIDPPVEDDFTIALPQDPAATSTAGHVNGSQVSEPRPREGGVPGQASAPADEPSAGLRRGEDGGT
jgi:hypothetical protein